MKLVQSTIISGLIFLALLATIFLPSFASAAGVPSVLSYQGRLTDTSGNLLGGSGTSYYFKFSLWNSSTVGSGAKLWPVANPTALTSVVRNGVFNVNIGDTTNGYPDVLDYNFTSANIFLQVEVSVDGVSYETLSPRQQISASAFSQVSAAVSGEGQSSIGATTPLDGNTVLSVFATTSNATALGIRAASSQTANIFSIEDSALNSLLYVNSSGGLFASSTLQVTGAGKFYSGLETNTLTISSFSDGCLNVVGGLVGSTGSSCGDGSGSGGGSWSTTTSNVAGRAVNYSNETTDIVTIGANSTTTAPFSFDPNIGNGGVMYLNGSRFLHGYSESGTLGNNTFVGKNAGNFTLSRAAGGTDLASFNTGFGTNVLQSLTTGNNNTALGFEALKNVTSGNRNEAIGYTALTSLTTGAYNTAIGDAALQTLTVGDGNVAIGYTAGYKLEGNATGNTFVGQYAGYDNITVPANWNSANTDNFGTLIGRETGRTVASTTQLTRYVAVGWRALVNKSNQAVFGGPTITETVLRGKTAINNYYNDPAAQLDVYGSNNDTTTDLFNASKVVNYATTTLFTIKSDGKVGIASTTPGAALSIQPASSEDYFYAQRGDSTAWLRQNFVNNFVNYNTNARYIFNINGTEQARIESTRFGINSTNPGSRLSVGGNVAVGSNYQSLGAPTNGLIVEGNVGVGTTSPFAKLSVGGGNIHVGGVVISTSTTASNIFPYASTTALSATTICLTGDTCRTTWPTGSIFPFTTATNYGLTVNSTTSPMWFRDQLFASSSAVIAGNVTASSFIATGTAVSTFAGNVGIGTTTSPVRLSVVAGVSDSDILRLTNTNWVDQQLANISFYDGVKSTPTTAIKSRLTGGGTSGILEFYAASSNVLNKVGVINNAGFGIDVNSPLAKFHLGNGSLSTGELIMGTYDAAGNYRTSISNTYWGGVAALNLLQIKVSNGTVSGQTVAATFTGAGSAGIGTTTPWRTLAVTGTLGLSDSLTGASTGNYLCINNTTYEVTSGTTCSASSERFKENVNALEYGLDTVAALRPVSFTYKASADPDPRLRLGFMAEEVRELVPELVNLDKDGLPESVDYAKMAPVLVKAIQELNAKIDAFTVFSGGLTVTSIGTSTIPLAFYSDITFFGRPYFTTDTAGGALIKRGAKSVEIIFDREYIDVPIVNASISLDDTASTDEIESLVFENGIQTLVTKRSVRGFTILLNKPAPADLTFSWTAFAVKNGKLFTSKAPEPEVTQNISPVVEIHAPVVITVPNATTTPVVTPQPEAATTTSESVVENIPVPSTTPEPDPAPVVEAPAVEEVSPTAVPIDPAPAAPPEPAPSESAPESSNL